MPKEFFQIKKVGYEGPKTKNPLAFRHYNADEVGRQKDEGPFPLRGRLLARDEELAGGSVRRRHRHPAVG